VPHAPVLRVGMFPMPSGLKRYYGQGYLHFLTFSCYQRRPLLDTAEARNLFVAALEKIRERHRFLVVGYVVMPDHVHLLIGEPAKGTPSLVLQALKQRVSRDLRKTERDGTCNASGSRGFMTSTFTVRRKEWKSSTTCTLTR
jgi:REP element-mobilizing transposase RayT